MSIFFLPALIALLFKLVVLAYALRAKRVSTMFLSLIAVFAIHNAIEFLGYFQSIKGMSGDTLSVFFRMYYVATVYVIFYILLHGLTVSRIESSIATLVLAVASTVLATLVLFSDLIIAGQYSIGYSMTAIQGPLYWVFAIYLLIVLFGNLIVLLYGHRKAKSQLHSVRCIHCLLALTPVMLVFLLAIGLKLANININATGLVPIATAIFLAISLKTESKHKLSDIRRFMPMSPERQTTTKIMDLLDRYLNDDEDSIGYKRLQEELEKEIIFYSLEKCNNNVSHTSEMMGLKNRSTLYSMMNRLNIDMKKIKQKHEKQQA